MERAANEAFENNMFPICLIRMDSQNAKYYSQEYCYQEHIFIRILDGTCVLTINDSEYRLSPGDIIMLGNNVLHRICPTRCVFEILFYNPEKLLNKNNICFPIIQQLKRHIIQPDINAPCYRPQLDVTGNRIHQTATELFNCLSAKGDGYQLLAQGLLLELIGRILHSGYYRKAEEEPGEPLHFSTELKKAMHYMEQNYSSAITLSDLARVANMSPNYFCRFFKKQTGMTPFAYLINYRLKIAGSQLLNSPASILDISFSCGFNSVNYFIQCFRNHYHCTPSQYREQNRPKEPG